MTTKEIIRQLKQNGWYEKNQKGSHQHFIHKTKKGKITVPKHSGDIPIGTAKAILKQAGLN